MKVQKLIKNFLNLPKKADIVVMRDGFDKAMTLEEALKCRRRVKFFSYYPEVFTPGEEEDDGHPELIIEIE